MVRSKRQQLHSRIADALVEGFPETVETQPELMAHHFGQAGLTETAVEYWRKAGRRAIERSANAEAIRHLTSALESLQLLPENPERKRAALELEVMLGQAMIADRGYAAPETRETLLRAKTLIDDLTDPRRNLPSSMEYGHPTMLAVKSPSRGTQPRSSLPRRNDMKTLRRCVLPIAPLAPLVWRRGNLLLDCVTSSELKRCMIRNIILATDTSMARTLGQPRFAT
jgi:hypothetical protein